MTTLAPRTPAAIPGVMKAIVLTAPGKFELREIPVPQPGPLEVVCKIRAVAICGSDPEIFRGDLAGTWPPAYPFVAGHEWAGDIVSVGPGFTEFQVGDRVAGQAHKGCGFCVNCLAGRYTICLNYGKPETGHAHYGFTTFGAYAQYAKYSIKSITPMPDNVSYAEGAMVDTAGVSLHGIELTGITPGGTVAVIGPGPIGMTCMRLARARGASKAIMVGRRARLEFAKTHGADYAVDFEQCDPVAEVRRLTDGFGVDEAFECAGVEGTMAEAIRMVKRGGRAAILGVPPERVEERVPFKFVVHNEIAVFGSRANPNVSAGVVNLMASGDLVVSDLITHRFAIEDFAEALETFVQRKDHAMKVVIEPNGEEVPG